MQLFSFSLASSHKVNCALKHCNSRPQSTFVSSEMCVVWEENAVAIRKTSTVYGMQSNQSAHKCNLCCRPSHSYTVNENICSIMCEIDSVLQLLVLLSRRFVFRWLFIRLYVCVCVWVTEISNQMILNYNSIYVTRKLHRTIINDVLLFLHNLSIVRKQYWLSLV